jgi:LPXTG-site transpeptidase (sortase) family protein
VTQVRTYTVQPGDTLTTIAASFGLPSWQPLYAANRDRLPNPHMVRVGQELIIPDATAATSSSPDLVGSLPVMTDPAPPHAAVAPPPPAAPGAVGAAEGRPEPVPAAPPVRLQIPAIALDAAPVPVGLDRANLPIVPKHDIGWYTYSAMPGQHENVVFWGHVSRWRDTPEIAAPFARLDELTPGAAITVATADGQTHRYVVSKLVQVRPNEVQYILPTGTEQVTLVSCIGERVILNGTRTRARRLIVIATPVSQ